MSFIPYDLNDDKLKKIQRDGLKWTVGHAYNNSSFYKKKLDNANIRPEDIRSLEDIEHLPFTDKNDLQQEYPFPLRAAPFKNIVRIHASSGTTGKRKVLCYTQRDIDVWADIFARCYEIAGLTLEDRVQIAVGYGLWTAGVGFQAGCERFGAMAVPIGPANAEMHCEMMVDMQTTVFCSTASMALLMAEEIHKRNLLSRIKVNKIILGAERHSLSMRTRIKELMGVEHIFDIYGLTELYGPGTGLDCRHHNGIHYWADHFIFEILDPETLKPVPYGQQGELVVTTLSKEGSPLIRYRTHDVTRLFNQKCSCGVPLPMHDRILGRTDDMFIYRAVNIYPSQIDHVLSKVDGIGSEFQIHLKQRESGRDMMLIKVERAADTDNVNDIHLAERLETEIRRKILVRCQVEILDHGDLPRTQRKSQRVFDHRNNSTSEA
ncbi:MAG: phenylacetate--CoA ligase [Deltaproteobacteria bacterium]|nr:phenylacetate--CoA ligase [Deltaproteobacteria bacterium]MBW1959093.1 phenylacetate--CoA ligase [Deltaproteobacteria bacterium]MBW2013799.1 phenylacetate--CoA ligase [Deltaproteobacteria bacterium]MBW2087417.1 phenylacetate--CoA ligase [Deltaproteobacteria bacterium]MBW2319870.1 phenylacetate--CoA ligase [Deltaproteobacteria bacterium]